MKKIIIISLLLFSFSGLIFAQGIYIRTGTGYGIPVATSIIGEIYQSTFSYGTGLFEESSAKTVSASYGAGANFGFGFGYKFNENIIVDFYMQYLAGSKFETSRIIIEDYIDQIYTTKETSTTYSRALLFSPSVIFSAGFGKRAPYAKVGIIVTSPKVFEEQYLYNDTDGINESEITWKYGGGLAIGFQTAVGINWEINEGLDIFSETNFVSMSYYAKEGNMTKNIRNDLDIMDQMVEYDKKILFEKDYDPFTPYDPAEPQIMASESKAFSFIAVQVGIRLTIWKKKDLSSGY